MEARVRNGKEVSRLAALISPEQVREQLGLKSVVTVYRMVADGRLPAVRISAKALRFRQEDVDAFVEKHLTTA
jgi:excisionase family DNA binding protein